MENQVSLRSIFPPHVVIKVLQNLRLDDMISWYETCHYFRRTIILTKIIPFCKKEIDDGIEKDVDVINNRKYIEWLKVSEYTKNLDVFRSYFDSFVNLTHLTLSLDKLEFWADLVPRQVTHLLLFSKTFIAREKRTRCDLRLDCLPSCIKVCKIYGQMDDFIIGSYNLSKFVYLETFHFCVNYVSNFSVSLPPNLKNLRYCPKGVTFTLPNFSAYDKIEYLTLYTPVRTGGMKTTLYLSIFSSLKQLIVKSDVIIQFDNKVCSSCICDSEEKTQEFRFLSQ